MTYAAKDATGKILAGFFGVFLFVCTGYEHCVANMAYLFAGLFSKTNPLYLEAAHKTAADAATINIPNMFVNNLIPVTIGNILGGAIFVAGVYYFLFVNKKEENSETEKAA
jgi:formate/nitrite transporter FocA (FNT family)